MQNLEAIIARNKPERDRRKHLSPQAVKLLDYLSEDDREVTQLVAVSILGIGSLSARIGDLRRAGYKIEGKRKHEVRGGTYTAYRLVETPHQRKKRLGNRSKT